jgi:hypothetical protein
MSATPHSPSETTESAPPEILARATELVKLYPECFWFWEPAAEVRQMEDIRLVIENLRKYGDRRAWQDAQELYRCLLPPSKRKF